jgi:hypothetical protein
VTVVTDDFTTGSNQDLSVYSANWTEETGDWYVFAATDRCGPQVGASFAKYDTAYYADLLAGVNNYAQSDTYNGTTNNIAGGPAVRIQGVGNDCYAMITFNGDAFYLVDALYVEADGDQISGTVDTDVVELGPITDSSLTTGYVGMAAYDSQAAEVPYWDNWEAGDLGAVVVTDIASMQGVGSASASALLTVIDSASMQGEGTLSVQGYSFVLDQASMQGEGALSVSGVSIVSDIASMQGEGTLSAIGSIFVVGTASNAGCRDSLLFWAVLCNRSGVHAGGGISVRLCILPCD